MFPPATDLALQVVGRLGPLDLHVVGQHRVVVQLLPVVLFAGQGLSVLGRHQVHHVRGELVLTADGQRVPLVLLLAGQPAGLQAVQQARVVRDALDPDVLALVLQVVVFVVVLQRIKKEGMVCVLKRRLISDFPSLLVASRKSLDLFFKIQISNIFSQLNKAVFSRMLPLVGR